MPHIKKSLDWLLGFLSLSSMVGLYYLFSPENFSQRVWAVFFCIVFVACIAGFTYVLSKLKSKADVSD